LCLMGVAVVVVVLVVAVLFPLGSRHMHSVQY
jgi:hypothetical protein